MRFAPLLFVALGLSACLSGPHGPESSPGAPTSPASPDLGGWKSHAADPLPRYELAVAQVGARVYVIGGLRASAVASSTVEVFDVQNNTWAPIAEYPGPVHHHAAIATPDGTVYSFGGWIGIGQSASDLAFRYSPTAAAWVPLGRMPAARGAHAAVLVEGKVWLVGGTGFDGGLLRSIDVFDPATGFWTAGPELPKPRDHLAAVVRGQEVWVLGGREKTLSTTTPEVQVYNLTTKEWSKGPEMTMRRGGFAAVVHEQSVYAMGGEDSDQPRLKNLFEVYDGEAGAWRQLQPMQRARTGLGGAVWQGRIFAIAGADPVGAPDSDAPESWSRSG